MRNEAFELDRLESYSEIAGEYYDAILHPTCASLRELSEAFLVPRIAALPATLRCLVEVGAGRSILAPVWVGCGRPSNVLTLLDSAPGMLAYSAEWQVRGASLSLAEASALPFEDGSVDVVVASLGDPYNCRAFWRETARVLRTGGSVLFTTPALEWSSRFRNPELRDTAEFLRKDGTVLLMPSNILSEENQATMFEEAGLRLEEIATFSVADLQSPPAPKLLCTLSGEPVLRGYALVRDL